MIEDTLRKLEKRLAASETLGQEHRMSLEAVVSQLRSEIASLNDPEKGDSIAGFSESSTREALRVVPDPDLLDISLTGLRKTVHEFEVSHPRLTAVVNDLCTQLSSLGI